MSDPHTHDNYFDTVITKFDGAVFPCEQLLEMVERNELSRSILALLDENIASAISNNQVAQMSLSLLPFTIGFLFTYTVDGSLCRKKLQLLWRMCVQLF